MLGILAIDETLRKMQVEEKVICNKKFLCVTIPKCTSRNLRHAAKKLRGLRVVVPDECDDKIKSLFCTVSSEGILCRLAFRLYMSALKEFKLARVSLLICSTYFGAEDFKMLFSFVGNARYISLNASNSQEIAEYLFENYGVAASEETEQANIIINMYEKNFSLHIINGGFKYTLREVKISLRGAEQYPLHIKGICLSLLQAGSITADDISIVSCEYDKNFLDIQ